MKIKNRQQLLVVLAVTAFALLIGDKIIFTPLVRSWKTRSETISELRQKLAKGELLVAREQVVRGRWTQMQHDMLPTETSLAEQQVLKALDSWAQRSGVSVNSITPQWKRDSDDFMTLECRVDAAGDLETLSQFLYNAEKDPMALKLDSVELSARDNNGQQLTLGLQVSGLALIVQKQ
jgi:Tfp pilus assembly protein PilO